MTASSRQRTRRRRFVGVAATEESQPSLASERGVDYSTLRDLLQSHDFKAADAETRKLLIVLAGEAAVKRGWVYFAEVRKIPDVDMLTLDGLWHHFSKGKFGFSTQRKIWRQCREQFDKFAEQVSWFTEKWTNRNWPDEFIYTLDAPVGHLPLTNCIRGAQVLQELLGHTSLSKKKESAGAGGKRSGVGMLALSGARAASSREGPAAFAGGQCLWAMPAASALRKGLPTVCRADGGPTLVAVSPAVVAASMPTLAALKEHSVINENGFVLPDIADGTQASAFVIYDSLRKAQYIGFSKDLRNTLRTLLCRRPELCYFYRCFNLASADVAQLTELRTAWVDELGGLPVGNKDARQKGLWESAVDGGALSERAYKTVAEQRAKQIFRQLKDRGLKEAVEFREDLLAQGKVDVLPSAISSKDLLLQVRELSSRTSSVEKEVEGKKVSFELFYASEFETKGGWWCDVELTASKSKSTHRVIVSKEFAASVGADGPRQVLENAFALLLAKKVPRKTEGLITSEVFPSNYFTATNLAFSYPEFLELFNKKPAEFDWGAAQWGFKQVHDYAQDDKRTIPTGPLGGFFDPAGLQ